MNKELKPCPFCGGKVQIMNLMTPVTMIYCLNFKECGAVVSFDNPICNNSRTDEPKIKAWNRRTREDNEDE